MSKPSENITVSIRLPEDHISRISRECRRTGERQSVVIRGFLQKLFDLMDAGRA